MGVVLWGIYSFYYTDRVTADIFKYFDDSKIMFDSFTDKPSHFFKMLTGVNDNTPAIVAYYDEMNFWQNKVDKSNHTIIRFNTIIRFFSLGYFNVHTVFMCFLSLIGLTAIYKTFYPVLTDKKRELIIVIFLIPSVLLWGSGVLKEGIIIFSMGLLIYNMSRLFSIKSLLLSMAAILLLTFSKLYVLVALIPSLLFILWINKTTTSNKVVKYIAVLLITLGIGLNIDKFTSIQNPLVTLSQKQNSFNLLAEGKITDAQYKPIAIPKSAIQINKLEPTLISLLRNSPQAFINTIFRPFIWEIKSPMMLIATIENLLVIAFIVLCLVFMKPIKDIPGEYIIFCSSFFLILFLIIGTSTPILGAIARYKVPALPFLLINFLLILDKNKIEKKSPIYSKLFR